MDNKQITGLVFAFLSVLLTYQVAIAKAQPASNTGANTSGINMTSSRSNVTYPNLGANTSGINMTSPNAGENTSGSGVNTTITKA
jgi:hypothetical protein